METLNYSLILLYILSSATALLVKMMYESFTNIREEDSLINCFTNPKETKLTILGLALVYIIFGGGMLVILTILSFSSLIYKKD